MSVWIWFVIVLVAGLVGYDMYRSRYTVFAAYDWGKGQGIVLRKQKYKNTKSSKKSNG